MTIEPIQFGGWPNCLRIANQCAELIVTLDVGPRIISYLHLPGGSNLLKTNPDELGSSGEDHFVARGGHRFWVAPENQLTYLPDNLPVSSQILPDGVALTVQSGPIRKELTITLHPDSSAVTITHRATNLGDVPLEIATWGLTVMEPGGLEIIPRPPLGEHPRDLLPDQVLVLWPYTDSSDDRWRWGREFITLRQTPHSSPAKIGLRHRQGWVGYLLGSSFFLKTVAFEENATYPDFGCNYETFTNAQMLELETLSPLRTLQTGESLAHTESWHLFGSLPEPESLKETALAIWLAPILASLQLPANPHL
ncbi:MAG: hypothetical protein WCI46_05120 [Verrucomicrobiota bacterium]